MNTRTGVHDDGPIGLGLLILMTVALIAGQLHSPSGQDTADGTSRISVPGQRLLFEPVATPAIVTDEGAIRELRVLPSVLADYPEFGWSSDEALIKEYSNAGF